MPLDPNNFTILNIGDSGSIMDETAVDYGDVAPVPNPYPLIPGSSVYRRRARTVLCGQGKDEISSISNDSIVGNEYALVTRPSIRAYQNSINEYDEAIGVSPNSLTPIVSYTTPVSTVFVFTGVKVSGDVAAKYTIDVNGNPYYTMRTTAANLDGLLNFSIPPFELSATDVLTISVIYYNSSNPSLSCDFESTIMGYEIV